MDPQASGNSKELSKEKGISPNTTSKSLNETMDHEASGNSKESSKEKGSSPNTTPKYLNETMNHEASGNSKESSKEKGSSPNTTQKSLNGNDESGKQTNNQYSAHDIETNLEMEIGGEDVIIPVTSKENKNIDQMHVKQSYNQANDIILETNNENEDNNPKIEKQSCNQEQNIISETNKENKNDDEVQSYNYEDNAISGSLKMIKKKIVSSIRSQKNTHAQITEKKLVILELMDIFYHSINDEATNKGHIEKMGIDADYKIEKKLFWIHPLANTFFEMCFKNEYFEIAIWMTASKQNTTRVLKKPFSEKIQDKLLFMWTASKCKPKKGHKAIDNKKKCIHTKSLKKVWEMPTQYDATNTIIVDCSLERMQGNPKENMILVPQFIGTNKEDDWLIEKLWRMLIKCSKATDVQAILKDV